MNEYTVGKYTLVMIEKIDGWVGRQMDEKIKERVGGTQMGAGQMSDRWMGRVYEGIDGHLDGQMNS